MSMTSQKRIIDLFAGVGGLSLGFELAGFEIVMANEIDKSIAESYKKNRPNVEVVVEDITKLRIEDTFALYKDQADVIIGGPPCQGFSQKGQRKSINDDRNFLFKYFFNVVKTVRPRYFVMENVPNLLTSENGYFKKEIFSLFESVGYSLNADVLNASDFGVPQNRRRAVIIGKLGKSPVSLPIPTNEKVSVWDAISDLNFLSSGEGKEVLSYPSEALSNYQARMRKNSTNLFNHVATNHSAIAIQRMRMIPFKGDRSSLPKEHLTKSIYSGTWARIDPDEVSVTITTRFDTPSSGRFTHPYLDRAITVREAARLQSFPDAFRFWGTKSSQMKQVGNAVPPLLAKAIAEQVLLDMKASD